jgi:NADP-dependent 3-hydroxy acid dehydrogenase YdfG
MADDSTAKRQKTEAAATPQRMSGKVCVVTGASSGIGEAIARALHQEGAKVCVGARREDKLAALCAELGEGSTFLTTDVAKRADMKALVAQAEGAFGKGVDLLVNVAGVMYFTMMKNCQEDEWERTVDVNCKGVMNGFGAREPYAAMLFSASGFRCGC